MALTFTPKRRSLTDGDSSLGCLTAGFKEVCEATGPVGAKRAAVIKATMRSQENDRQVLDLIMLAPYNWIDSIWVAA
jgi:hypothetical protein